MKELHKDIKGVNYVLKNSTYTTDFKKKILDKVYKGDITYAYRVHYHDYWELEKFMELFNFNITSTKQKTLSKKIIDCIGDNLPIFRIGGEAANYKEFKGLIQNEFEFINDLIQWVDKHFPGHKERAIKQLEQGKIELSYRGTDESEKALEILKMFHLNQTQNIKVFLLEKLLAPYILDDILKQDFISLFKLQKSQKAYYI